MKPSKQYSKEDVAEMKRLRKSGISVKEIAERFCCSDQTIYLYMHYDGVKPHLIDHDCDKRVCMDKVTREKLTKMYLEEGVRPVDIARELNRPYGQIYSICRRLTLTQEQRELERARQRAAAQTRRASNPDYYARYAHDDFVQRYTRRKKMEEEL